MNNEYYNKYLNFTKEEIDNRVIELRNLIINTDIEDKIPELNNELNAIVEVLENKYNIKERSYKMENYKPQIEVKESEDVLSTKEYRNAFYKTVLGKELSDIEKESFNKAKLEKRTDVFGTLTNNAAVIPTNTLNEIISKARTEGGILDSCRSFNVPCNLAVPVATPSSNASWHTEGANVDRANVSTAKVSFSAYEILKVFSISAANNTFSIEGFESYLVDELNKCVMGTLESALVSGTGSSQGKGFGAITYTATGNSINNIKYTNNSTPTYANFLSTAALLKHGYAKNAKWAMNYKTLLTHCYGLVDTDGKPLLITDLQTQPINYILGKPVVIDDNISDNDIYFGDFSYMGYNLPSGIVLEVSRDSGFTSGLIDYRALAIADCKPIVEEAFVKLSMATA